MDGIDTSRSERAAVPKGAPTGIFLHAGWRSCGTWIWERLRDHACIQAFYEPLHEDLAHLRQRDIGQLRPDSWQSGHSAGAPYFSEYAPLLGPKGGVRGHRSRFAFDDYFPPSGQADAELEQYLRGLLADASGNARVPVLKFCRSLGRVPWLEARFPDVLHAVILRDPQAQWRSARRQMEHDGNHYFIVAPFVIFARNSQNPLLASAAEQLGVDLPPAIGRHFTLDLSVTTDACWRHVSRLSWQQRFRGFLALWVASGLTSIQGNAMLIDADRLWDEPAMRCAAETVLAQVAGTAVNLTPDNAHSDSEAGRYSADAELHACMQAAQAFLAAHAGEVAADRIAVLAGKLQPCVGSPAIPPARVAVHPNLTAYLDAAAYVALMRASYPLRRAHFHVRRVLGDNLD